jgi:hypothetical protein
MRSHKTLLAFRLGCLASIMMAILLFGGGAGSPAQQIPVNYDEPKVGSYVLPDPLILEDGSRVRDAATWYRQRRPELLHLFEDNIYGRSPAQAPRCQLERVRY